MGADIDDDGTEELLVMALGWPDGERRGRVYGLDLHTDEAGSAPLVLDGDPGVQYFGNGLVSADFDQDGISDLAVGAPGYGVTDVTDLTDVAGRVFVFYGPVAGRATAQDADRVFAGAHPGDTPATGSPPETCPETECPT